MPAITQHVAYASHQRCLRYARGMRPAYRSGGEYTLGMRIREYILAIVTGLGIGVLLVSLFFVITVFIPMWTRRYQMGLTPFSSTVASATEAIITSSQDDSDVEPPEDTQTNGTDERQDADTGSPTDETSAEGETSQESLPPIDWESIMTDEERHNLEAFRQDVRSMMDAPQYNLLAWPVLPYPIAGIDNWNDRFENFTKLADAAYNEEPEISVYTNGQCANNVVAIAKYHLIEAEGSTPEENRREYEEVVQAADNLDAKIRGMMTEPECRDHLSRGQCTEDEMYVILLYRELATRTTYSDDIDDTEHANDIYGALLEDESKCYGVASATQALLNRRGIPSFMASGSLRGDDDRRHAWVVLWIDNQWKTIDITYAQAMEPADMIDVEAATTGQSGYWGGCMRDYETYVTTNEMVVDQDCLDLMATYEKQIGAEHRITVTQNLQRTKPLARTVLEILIENLMEAMSATMLAIIEKVQVA